MQITFLQSFGGISSVFLFPILLLRFPMPSFVCGPYIKVSGFPLCFQSSEISWLWALISTFFSLTMLDTWRALMYGTPCLSPLCVLFWCYFNDFLPSSFSILSLLSCYNQKINFPNRSSEFFILFLPQSYIYFKNLIAGNFSQLYLPTILLL